MKSIIFASIVAATIGSAALAADLAGEVSVDVTETVNGDYIATPSIDLSFGSKGDIATAFAGVDVVSTYGFLEVDEWYIGAGSGDTTVSFGDQGDLLSFSGLETVGGETLNLPSDDHVSLMATYGAFSGLVGFTNIESDISDVENVQMTYSYDMNSVTVTGAVDYNLNSEDYLLAVSADITVNEQLTVDAVVTYGSAVETLAYQTVGTYDLNDQFSVSALINGDQDDLAQNVGAGVTYTNGSLSAYAEVGYNVDTDTAVPAVGVSFSF